MTLSGAVYLIGKDLCLCRYRCSLDILIGAAYETRVVGTPNHWLLRFRKLYYVSGIYIDTYQYALLVRDIRGCAVFLEVDRVPLIGISYTISPKV